MLGFGQAGENGPSKRSEVQKGGLERGHLPERHAREHTVSVIIPAKNEEKNIPHVLANIPPWVSEVIVVDGLSTDNTLDVARDCYPGVGIVAQPGRGKGDALREGFAHCTGDFIVAIDADCSMSPTEIERLVDELAAGADYVKGSRYLVGGGSADLTWLRNLGNKSLGLLANVLHGCRYSDLCYGFFGFRRNTIDRLPLRSDGFEIETEINIKAHKAGLQIAEFPSYEADRLHGESSLHPVRDGLRIVRTIIQELFRDRDLESLIDE